MPASNTKTSKAFFAAVSLFSGLAFSQVPMPLPISAPQPGMQMRADAAAAGLTFRDPAKPITIGEISELQAKKANADLYKRFGFTGSEPVKIKPKIEAPVKVVPTLSITTLAVWGKSDALQAEAMVDGILKKFKGGESVAPGVTVIKVTPSGLQLEVSTPSSKVASSTKKNAKGLVVSTPDEPVRNQSKIAYVGRGLEIRL